METSSRLFDAATGATAAAAAAVPGLSARPVAAAAASQAYARAVAASSVPAKRTPSPPLSSFSPKQCPQAREAPAPSPTDDPLQQTEAVLAKVLDLEELDVNMYRGYNPEVPKWGRVYGGTTISQALASACRTVDPRFIVHSLHAYFLRPGDDDLPIIYYVERLRNGSSFASRRVTALQKGAAIFAMMASFQTEEGGLEHQRPMPEVPPPESIKSLMDTYRDMLQDPRFSRRVKAGLERSISMPFPMDLRRCVPESLEQRLQKNPPVQRSWMRVQGQLGNSLMLHQCALAYMSDWSLLETTLLPHGLHGWIQPNPDNYLQMASIDHSMWFHHAFRADEWLLHDMESFAASNGRGLAHGRFYTRDGKLIVTTAQEGLIRVRSLKKDAAAKAAKARANAAATAAAAAAAAASASLAADSAAASASAASSDSAGPATSPTRKGTDDPTTSAASKIASPASFSPVVQQSAVEGEGAAATAGAGAPAGQHKQQQLLSRL